MKPGTEVTLFVSHASSSEVTLFCLMPVPLMVLTASLTSWSEMWEVDTGCRLVAKLSYDGRAGHAAKL